LQRERDEGYQKLVELCNLGEYDMAQQLANQHFNGGYEIVDGIVMERID
jgi:DNA-binding FadR family transcriptional regulator